MKILGISASPRAGKTSKVALEAALAGAKEAVPQVETVLVELAGKTIHGCLACGKCAKELSCSQDDDFNALIPLLDDPDLAGIITATPIYFGSLTSQAKAFWDRAVMFRRHGFKLRNKVGGAIGVGGFRNGGQELAIQTLHAIMLVQDMVIVSDGMPTSHFGGTCVSGAAGSLDDDDFGLGTCRGLGRRVAEVAAKLAG
ncbi:MAG: flavodoxin family protein [Deltaproteobacteria bacterium]|nr:flavodoxin family protein [Deltaproteobacteria bacterium]